MNTVRIAAVRLYMTKYRLDIEGTGHPTEFIEACREIAIAILRGRYRWWFQSIHGELGSDSVLVSDFNFSVTILFGD